MELLIRTTYPIWIDIRARDKYRYERQEQKSKYHESVTTDANDGICPPRDEHLYDNYRHTEEEEIHLLPFKRSPIPYHDAELHKDMREVEWESEEDE